MDVRFKTYCGLAGDLQELLIGEAETGITESELYNCTGLFKLYSMRKAKRKILKRIELLTGRKPKEI
jgi:hypothetical protein